MATCGRPDPAGATGGAPLTGLAVHIGGDGAAIARAARLLGLLGADMEPAADLDGLCVEGGAAVGAGSRRDPVADWAASGAMWLTGTRRGPPLVAPGAPASAARGASLAIEALTAVEPALQTVAVDGAQLLGERAALSGLGRRGSISPGGSCRLIAAADALLAVNLPRRSDVELVPAWLQVDTDGDPWGSVMTVCAGRAATELVQRAQMIGIPVAIVPEPPELAADEQSRARRQTFPLEPWRVFAERRGPVPRSPGTVVDLSSMWAGPLCANLLSLAGFQVIKVESAARPDGARLGPPLFYDLLHAGHRSVALDFSDTADVARLRALMASADVVIESSRPRALDQLGLGPEAMLGRSRSTVWVSITGYGRSGPWNDRVAFGDDAAAAGGMVTRADDGSACFCGDAIADPLTGLHAALAALAMWRAGRGGLVDVPLRDVAASTFAGEPADVDAGTTARGLGNDTWVIDTADGPVSVAQPLSRPVVARSAPMGADNGEIS